VSIPQEILDEEKMMPQFVIEPLLMMRAIGAMRQDLRWLTSKLGPDDPLVCEYIKGASDFFYEFLLPGTAFAMMCFIADDGPFRKKGKKK
jgi:hypothetical protein